MAWPLKWTNIVLFCFMASVLPDRSLQQVVNIDMKYLGCYADDDTRTLRDYNCVQGAVAECPDCSAHRSGNALGTGVGCQNPEMTVDLCLSLCLGNGHVYAGLQSGSECFCGNEGALYQKLQRNETKCNIECVGDTSKICGGNYWSNVYDLRKSCLIPELDVYLFPSKPTTFGGEMVIFDEGETLSFTCQSGYTLNGPGEATCQMDGTWSPNIPTCTAPATVSQVTCPQLSALTNGIITPSQLVFREGDTARFHCESGYLLIGSNTSSCNAQGDWSPEGQRTCEALQCDDPPDAENAFWAYNALGKMVFGSAVYQCNDGFTPDSGLRNPALICNESYQWSGDPMISCVEGRDGNQVTSNPARPTPANEPSGNGEETASVPALVWILIVIVIICLIIFLAGCIILRTGSSSGPRDYKQRDPLITDGVVVTREGDKVPNHHGVPLTTGTAFIGPAGSAVRNNDPEIGIPAENYSSRATSEASGTLRGNQTMDLTEAEADRYIDSLFDIDGFDGDNNNPANDVVGPYHPTMGGFGRGPSPHHHPEDDDYPPPPPEAHQYHDLERQRLDTPPQQAIYADTPGGSMDLPAHSGPSGSGSRNMYLPPAHDYPSVSNPNNSPSPVPSEDKSIQHPEKDFLDEVDEFFDGVNNKIDSCMMQ